MNDHTTRGYCLLRGIVMAAILVFAIHGRAHAVLMSPVERALESAVRIEVTLSWPDQRGVAQFSGSGWTRACAPASEGFDLVVSTAGHVIDVASLDREARPEPHSSQPVVKVVVIYRDGRQFTAGRDDLCVDRVHDYGEIRTRSPLPRTVLPVGVTAEVSSGDHLFTIASPGLLTYAYFEGHVILSDSSLVSGVPEGAWLSSIPVAPGASGAPVLNDDGMVVATVVAYVRWPWGGEASVVVALPPALITLTASQYHELEVTRMGFFDSLVPIFKLGLAAGVALALYHVLLPLLRRSPRFSQNALEIVMAVCEKVVAAIEQAHGDLAGIDKKRLAEEMIGEILSRMGIRAPKALIDAGIESAVLILDRFLGKKVA